MSSGCVKASSSIWYPHKGRLLGQPSQKEGRSAEGVGYRNPQGWVVYSCSLRARSLQGDPIFKSGLYAVSVFV